MQPLQKLYAGGGTFFNSFVVPYGYLYLAYMGFCKQKHGKPGLAYTSAYRERKLAGKQHFMESQLSPIVASRFGKL